LTKFPNLNFRIAIGNCDVDQEKLAKIKGLKNIELAEILEFEIEGRKFGLAHKIEDLRNSKAQILISGHSHIPSAKNNESKLLLNPGSLQDDGGYFLLNLKNLEVERKLFAEKI
jgi:putative phosphoesterase